MAKRPSIRGSFQQLLLFAFLLITALLVGVALRSVLQYDVLMTQSRDAAARALRLSGASQSLAERSAAMERAGRQSLVLNDAVLRRRFDDAAREAHQVLDRLEKNGLPPAGIDMWRTQLGVIEGLMSGSADSALQRESTMAMQFRELDALNTNLAQQAQFLIETQNDALAKRIENARRRQIQYLGKLMRSVDDEPIRAGLALLRGESSAETARLHRLERLRVRLLEDEAVLTEIAAQWPGVDLQHLRTLRRNALKEKENNKPPKNFRAIFQILQELDQKGVPAAQEPEDE